MASGIPCNKATATRLVDCIHNGTPLDDDLRSAVRAALVSEHSGFKYNRVWLHVTTKPPHHGVLRRLAVCVGLSADAIAPIQGYISAAEFHAELDGWMAWFAVPRKSSALRNRLAVERAISLFGGAVAEAAHVEAPKRKRTRPSNDDDDSDDEPAVAVPEVDSRAGITSSLNMNEASRKVRKPVVTDALLANQRVGALGIPTGMLMASNSRAQT